MSNLSKTNSSLIEGKSVLLSEEITIFLFDCSSSMYDSFRIGDYTSDFGLPRGSKFDAMQKAALDFVSQRVTAIKNGAKDSLGIITFGDEIKLLHDPMSTNFELLIQKLKKMRCSGSTPMAGAVRLAIETSERFSSGMIRVIICSDGQPDYKQQVLDVVEYAFNTYGIVFDTIGIGDSSRSYGLDEDFLKLVANLGGGEYTKISSYSEFSQKFLSIESERQLLIGNGILMLEEGSSHETDN